MTRKSAASVKLKDKAPEKEDPNKILEDWKKGELLKVDSMKNQLRRPDSYLKIRSDINRVCDDIDVKTVDDVVYGLQSRFDSFRKTIEEATVESIVKDLDKDPFSDMFKMVEPDMEWGEIVVQNIYFETIRPFAEHYFQIVGTLVEAGATSDGKEE